MVRVIILVQLLFLFVVLKRSDGLQNDLSTMENEERLRCKHETLALKARLASKEGILDNYKEIQKQMQATIDSLTVTEEANNRTIQELRNKQKQLLETIENETKTEETNKWTIQELLDKQTQQTLEAMNQMLCLILQSKDVCRYLLEAAESGDVNTTKRLAHCNSDSCTADDEYRQTPLIIAAADGKVEVVRVLMEGGADVQRGDVYMNTPLHYAAGYGRLEVCRLILDWGAKVNTQNMNNETALDWAAHNGHLSVGQLLVERGADVMLENVDGQTAADVARGREHKGMADWLDLVNRV